MRHGSLFSGIGGFDLAAEWMGWENVFHCEWMEFPRKVLEYHFPNADSLIDICKTDFKKYANKIDILTGGFPCQPFSMAGKRKGTDDERYLWGEMLRAVQEIKPQFVIAENVFGITNIDGGMVFEQVCLDLEAEGYEVQQFIIPAAAKNAPHRRDRVWFVAYSKHLRCLQRKQQRQSRCKKRLFKGLRNNENVTYSNSGTKRPPRKSGSLKSNGSKGYLFTEQRGKPTQFDIGRYEFLRDATDTTSTRRRENNWKRKSRFNDKTSSPNYWGNFPTESPICSRNDGLPTKLDGITFSKWRAESIKGYGNAIVPEVAYEIFKQLKFTK
jgi:DNA (cytosine-5)-methyltransferase 1